MTPLPNADGPPSLLGIASLDAAHGEFVRLAAALAGATEADFPGLFQRLLEHTRLHFAEEGRLMRLTRFPALSEHEAEHMRVLGELLQLDRQLQRGRMSLARAYAREGLPAWFALHLASMDSALARHIHTQQAVDPSANPLYSQCRLV